MALKLAYVAPRYAPFIGGVEVHVSQLARRIAAQGHRVEILAQECDRHLPMVETMEGIIVRRFPMLLPTPNLAVAPSLWPYLRRHAARFDLIHAHGYHALPALAAALTSHRPLVFTPHYHGTGHTPFRAFLHRPYRPLGAALFRRAGQVICVSEAEAVLVRRHFPETTRRLVVVPNGIESELIRAAQPYPVDGAVVLSVGRLEPYKRVHRLIEAMALTPELFVLKVIGAGPTKPALADLADRLGLAGRVEFLGAVSNEVLYRWYRTARVYVTCSDHEAFGMTVWEALAAQARVVASDLPAHREVLTRHGPEVIALLPLAASPTDLARAIITMAGDQGRGAPRAIPTWDEVAADTLRIYQTVLDGSS